MAETTTNKKTATALPRNTLRVDFTKRVRGFIVRGHAHLGVEVARDYKLRDRFEEGYFVFAGEVYARLTDEALAAVARDGVYEDYVLGLARDGNRVEVEVDLKGSTSKATFGAELISQLRNFLRDGDAFGRAIAQFLSGKGAPKRSPQKNKGSNARRAIDALSGKSGNRKANRGSGSGKPRGTGAKLGDVAAAALGEVRKDLTRAQAARHGSGGKKGKGRKTQPAPATEPTPAAPAPATEAAEPVVPSITGRQVGMYLASLRANGGDLGALPLSTANRAVVRDAAIKNGVHLKEDAAEKAKPASPADEATESTVH